MNGTIILGVDAGMLAFHEVLRYGELKRGSLTLPFKPHNTQILYLSLLWAYFFVKFVKIMCASLR